MGLKHLFPSTIRRKILAIQALWNGIMTGVAPDAGIQNSPLAMVGVGCAILGVLLVACLFIEAGQIEEDLAGQVEEYASQSGFDWLSVKAEGQNLILSGSAPHFGDRRDALEYAENIWGVNVVTNNILLLGEYDTCQQEFDRYLSVGSIEFDSAGSRVSTASLPMIDRLSDIARNCNAKIRITGHTDSQGAASHC